MGSTSTSTQALEALMQFLYQAPIGLVQTDDQGDITLMNPMAVQLLMPIAPGGDLLNLFDVLALRAPDLRRQATAAREPGAVVCEALPLHGIGPHGEDTVLALRLARLDSCTLMASLNDITLATARAEQRLSLELRDASRIDSLTLLPNRTAMRERVDQALQRVRSDPAQLFAVLVVNADRFNRINVMLGPAAADELLRQIAARLNSAVRERDAVARPGGDGKSTARLGGDEFVVLLEALRSVDDARAVAQRLVDTLARPHHIGKLPVHISCSIGVVLCQAASAAADADADSVLQEASLAMREAKRAGGGRLCVYQAAMKESAQRRGSIESELRTALLEEQLFVVYQPIVSLKAGGMDGAAPVAGVEALVRWKHPQRGLLPPAEFIEIAEETGQIGALGVFVLRTACRQFMAWQQQLGAAAPRTLSVNLSRAQLLDPDIAVQVRLALQQGGMPAARLQLEVTESLAAQDETVRARLHELKALGLSLALDDFGTGYSSLSSLHLLPIDVVKIDRSFVSQAERSPHHRVLIEATVRVAQSLGMRTVAEGIETEGQAAILGSRQCDKGQGYLFARPLPADEATRWLQARAAALSASG